MTSSLLWERFYREGSTPLRLIAVEPLAQGK